MADGDGIDPGKPVINPKNPFKGLQWTDRPTQEGQGFFSSGRGTAPVELPGGRSTTKYTEGINQYTNPFYQDPTMTHEDRAKLAESGLASVQSSFDKWGNGAMKFAGSFTNGLLSTIGTIYGIAASPFTLLAGGNSQVWDNPFSRLGDDVSTAVNESFSNYRDMKEQNASAWSPSYWLTTNFIADNILGNLGYAASAYVTGLGLSKVLSGLAPFIAGKNLKGGLDILAKGGIEELLGSTKKAYNAVETWDKVQQGLSIGISTSGEASTEAIQTYRETKKDLTDAALQKYGSKELIPDSVIEGIENDSRHAGNVVYLMNLPVIAGANVIQWGRALSPFKSELKAFEKNPIKLKAAGGLFGGYAEAEAIPKPKGLGGLFTNKIPNLVSILRDNLSEAAQEGEQYIAQEGTKNWYKRDSDLAAWSGVEEFTDPYYAAAVKLLTTQEGVANLLGGFAGGSPFAASHYIQDKLKGPKEKSELAAQQLEVLNNPDIKENLKIYLINMARHNSAQADLNHALANNDEHAARNAKLDVIKSFISSRIKIGRGDILNNELEQMRSMSNEAFKEFLGIDADIKIDKDKVLDSFKGQALEMQDTYRMMDRVFSPDMYRLGKLPPDEQKKKLGDLQEYKDMLWNYMIDFKDREKRRVSLDAEVTSAFGNLLQVAPFMEDKFGSHHELNDLYRQYVAVEFDHGISKEHDPNYDGSKKEADMLALRTRIKKKMDEVSDGNPSRFLSIEDIMTEGKKDYLENYMMNVNKQIKPILQNPIARVALPEADINTVIQKMHDLTKIHSERRMAIHSYNQLASMIKNGTYMDRFMNNPDYDKEKHKDIPSTLENGEDNPDYVPERIPSDKMLEYDGYKKSKDEIKTFYDELKIKDQENADQAAAYEKTLNALIDETTTKESKPYHKLAKEYQNGSEKIKDPYSQKKDEELNTLYEQLKRKIGLATAEGRYDTSTRKARENFKTDEFIDVRARAKAVRDELIKRSKKRNMAIYKEAQKIVGYFYANRATMSLDDLVPGFTIKRTKFSDEAIALAKMSIEADDKKKAEEFQEKKRLEEEELLRKQEEERKGKQPMGFHMPGIETLVTDDMVNKIKEGTLSSHMVRGITDDIVLRLAGGQTIAELSTNERFFVEQFPDAINKALKAKGLEALSERDLTGAVGTEVEPTSLIIEEQHAMIELSIGAVHNEAKKQIHEVDGPSFLRFRRSDVEYDPSSNENIYNEDNNVILKDANILMFKDPLTNPYNLNNKPLIRLRATGRENNGEPEAVIEIGAPGLAWVQTGWFMQGLLDKNGKPIETKFNDGDNNEKRVTAYKELVKRLQGQLKIKGSLVDMIIRNDPGFGHLIENKKMDDGVRQGRGVLEVASNVNDPNDPNSVLIGVSTKDSLSEPFIGYKDPLGDQDMLSDVSTIPGVYVNPALLRALARNKKGEMRQFAGQYVMYLPTGKLGPSGKSYQYFPILMAGKMLNAHMSTEYSITSGANKRTPVNMGEILIDVLLNPHKEEYAYLWPKLFAMAGMQQSDFKGIWDEQTKWREFYTNSNVDHVINQLFFSNGGTIASIGTVKNNKPEYTVPFHFEIQTSKDAADTGAVRAHISIADPRLKEKQSVQIFVLNKLGQPNRPVAGQEEDYVQARIKEHYSHHLGKVTEVPEAKQVSYGQIQDVIKNKAFHVQIEHMSKKLSDAESYMGFLLNEEGKLDIHEFGNYFKYVDALGLAQVTIQPIKDNKGNMQYFINQRVYMQEKTTESKEPAITNVKDVEVGTKTVSPLQPVTPVAGGITKDAADLLTSLESGSKPAFISKKMQRIAEDNGIDVTRKTTVDDVITALKARQKPATTNNSLRDAVKAASKKTSSVLSRGRNKKEYPKDDEIAKLERKRQEELKARINISDLEGSFGIIQSPTGKYGVVEDGVRIWFDTLKQAEDKINAKYDAQLAELKENDVKPGDILPMLDVRSALQLSMVGPDAEGQHYQRAIVSQLSGMLLDDMLSRKGNPLMKIQSDKKGIGLKEKLGILIRQRMYAILQEVRPSIKDTSYKLWTTLHPSGDPITDKEQDDLEYDKFTQYFALQHALDYDDEARFKAAYKEQKSMEGLEAVIEGYDKDTNEPLFFVGYLNLAIQQVSRLNIVQLINDGEDVMELNEDKGAATRTFDDGWYLRVDPKSTIGQKAKMILNRIPFIRMEVDPETGIATKVNRITETGEEERFDYDTAFQQIEELGLVSMPLTFRYNLLDNPAYNLSPVIRSLRDTLLKIKETKGDSQYNQIIQQLSPVVSHKRNDMHQVYTDMNGNTNMGMGSKSNISHYIIANWQGQFMQHIADNKYITETQNWDTEHKFMRPEYKLAVDFGAQFKEAIAAIFASPAYRTSGGNDMNFDGYLALARTIKKMTGIELVEDDFIDQKKLGVQTANLFQSFRENKNTNKKDYHSLAYYIANETIPTFQSLFENTIAENVINTVALSVKNGTYNPDNPLEKSSTSLDILARLFQPYHQTVTNPQSKGINGQTQFAIVTASMINYEFQKLQEESYLRYLKGLPIGKDDYFLNELFSAKGGEWNNKRAGTLGWNNMMVNSADGISISNKQRRLYDKFQARGVSNGPIELMSMFLYQSKEKESKSTSARKAALYYVPFGDSTAANIARFKKFAFNFTYNDRSFLLSKGGVHSPYMILYSQFKNEVNRAHATFKIFNNINNDPTLSLQEKKNRLTNGYHYIEDNGLLIPGAGTRINALGEYGYEIKEDSQIYETTPYNDDTFIATGMNPKLIKDDVIDDGVLDPIFKDMINATLTDVINNKVDIMMTYIDALMPSREPEYDEESGKWLFNHHTTPFNNAYVKNMNTIFGGTSFINGKTLKQTYAMNGFDTKEEAIAGEYRKAMLTTMIIDQQVNHMIFLNNLLQKTTDMAVFDNNGDYDAFVTNATHRTKMLNTPNGRAIDDSSMNIIAFNDVTYGHNAIDESSVTIMPMEAAAIRIMKENLEQKDLDKYFPEGMIPVSYDEMGVLYYTHKDEPVEDIVKLLKDHLESKLTDGGSVKTVREYLYQQVVQGTISSDQFANAREILMDKDAVIKRGQDGFTFSLRVDKMVTAGTYESPERLISIYVKDAEFVIIPALVKGKRFEPALDALHARESQSSKLSPGIKLAPMSALKISSAKPVDIFDKNGNYIPGSIENAEILYYPRPLSGRQQENPATRKSTISTGGQLQKYLFTDMHEDQIIGADAFSGDAYSKDELEEARLEHGMPGGKKKRGFAVPKDHPGADLLKGKPVKERKPTPAKGLRKEEAMEAMNNLLREMGNDRLQNYVDKNGLVFSVSDAWKQAFTDSGIEDLEEFDAKIHADMSSKDPIERAEAVDLYVNKVEVQVTALKKMIKDIKQQAHAKKGMDVSQLTILDNIEAEYNGVEVFESLKMSLSFAPGNKQYQQILLAEMEAMVKGVPMHGFAGSQVSSYLHGELGKADDLGVKGYKLTYDKDGKEVIGFETAEIAVPWKFKDKRGRLLKYEKYVDEQGKPRPGMFTKEMLDIISYRIPNTGLNMSGRFRIARFNHPRYGDGIQVPNIVFSQMSSDLDYDKIYNYVFNYTLEKEGLISKTKGVLHMRQNDALEILDTLEAKRRLIASKLDDLEPGFIQRKRRVNEAYKLLMKEVDEANRNAYYAKQFGDEDEYGETEVDGNEDEVESEDEVSNAQDEGISVKDFQSLKEALDKKAAEATTEDSYDAKGLLERYKSIKDEYDEMTAKVDKYMNDTNFDMRKELTNPKKPFAYIKAQSYAQKQNAVQDLYHYILSDMASLKAMTTPLAVSKALETIVRKRKNGKSYAEELRGNNNKFNSEVYQTENRARQAAALANVGILAFNGTVVYDMQTANMSLGNKMVLKGDETEEEIQARESRPILYLNEDGSIPLESDNEDLFTGPEFKPEAYYYRSMVYRIGEQTYRIPYRLNRKGSGKLMQSFLQGYLDATKTPEIFYSNVNRATIRGAQMLISLNYADQAMATLKQEILVEYAKAFENDRTDLFKKLGVKDLINSMFIKAGSNMKIEDNVKKADVGRMFISMMPKNEDGSEVLFKLSELEDMIDQRFDGRDKDPAYYMKQLYALSMFLRADEAGKQILGASVNSNLESGGFNKGARTLLGVEDQITNYENIGKETVRNEPNIIGSERLSFYSYKWNPTPASVVHRQAFDTLRKTFKWLYGDHNMFSDFQAAFQVPRDFLSKITRKSSLKQKERFNINLIQFYLSNVSLYEDFMDVIPEEYSNTISQVRRAVINGGTYKKDGVETNFDPLAVRINKMRTTIDEKTGKPYGGLYPILSRLKTLAKLTSADPSWVYTFNRNNFQQNAASEIPHDVALMLNDPNPEIQAIAKMLFLYHYSGGGVTTPISFGHMLPQEYLHSKNGFADRMRSMQKDMNVKMQALDDHTWTIKDYTRPRWFRYFDPAVVGTDHIEAATMLYNLYVNYIRHNPKETSVGRYTEYDKESNTGDFIANPDEPNIVYLTDDKMEDDKIKAAMPASFTDLYSNVYIINFDYKSYTRYGRLGISNQFAEYDIDDIDNKSIMRNNLERFETKQQAESRLAAEGQNVDETDDVELPAGGNDIERIQLDKEQPASVVLNHLFKENEQGVVRQINETGPNVNVDELTELNALGTYIKHLVPATTKFIGYSVKKAKAKYQSMGQDGHLVVEQNGKAVDALGYYATKEDKIHVAFGYADRDTSDPLLNKKIILHEAGHAVMRGIILTLEAHPNNTKADNMKAAAILRKAGDGTYKDIQRMREALKELNTLRGELKNNTVLIKAYMKHRGNNISHLEATDNLKTILSSPDEFISYLFNNKAFRDSLKEVPYKQKSIFDRILEFFKELFGLQKGTAAYAAFDSIFTMLEPVQLGKTVDITHTYKGGFENKGKGTTQGDGKDKAMRSVADGFIGEVVDASQAETNIINNKSSTSSTETSFKHFSTKDTYDIDVTDNKTITGVSGSNKVIMLARNGALQGKALTKYTKNTILDAFNKGASFVVGDMPNVDSQFIDYLQKIGAEFTIYHTGPKSRITIEKEYTEGSGIPALGYRKGDIAHLVDANNAKEKTELLGMIELYRGVSNLDVDSASPEELKIYDQLVKNNKIIC